MISPQKCLVKVILFSPHEIFDYKSYQTMDKYMDYTNISWGCPGIFSKHTLW
jgi:hypothetical protein